MILIDPLPIQINGMPVLLLQPHIRVWNSNSLDTICVIGVDYFEDAVFALAFSNKVNNEFTLFSLVHSLNDLPCLTKLSFEKRRQTFITELKTIFSRETPCCNLELFERSNRAHWVYQYNDVRRTLEGAVYCLNKLAD